MLKNVHHINLLVKDLDAAVQRYQQTLGISEMLFGNLAQRGVRTARFQVGDTWIVLVQPTDPDGVPGRHLAAHGEGVFLLSLEVESVADAVADISERGGQFLSEQPRQGLEDWQVVDLDPQQFFGVQLQLVEQAAPPEG